MNETVGRCLASLAASQQREAIERIHRHIVARMEELDPAISEFERGAFSNLKAQASWIEETFLRALPQEKEV